MADQTLPMFQIAPPRPAPAIPNQATGAGALEALATFGQMLQPQATMQAIQDARAANAALGDASLASGLGVRARGVGQVLGGIMQDTVMKAADPLGWQRALAGGGGVDDFFSGLGGQKVVAKGAAPAEGYPTLGVPALADFGKVEPPKVGAVSANAASAPVKAPGFVNLFEGMSGKDIATAMGTYAAVRPKPASAKDIAGQNILTVAASQRQAALNAALNEKDSKKKAAIMATADAQFLKTLLPFITNPMNVATANAMDD